MIIGYKILRYGTDLWMSHLPGKQRMNGDQLHDEVLDGGIPDHRQPKDVVLVALNSPGKNLSSDKITGGILVGYAYTMISIKKILRK